MNSSGLTNLHTCVSCKEDFPLDLDPKILAIIGGSLLCDACSQSHDPRAEQQQQQIPEVISLVADESDEAVGGDAQPKSPDPKPAGEKVEPHHCTLCRETFAGGELCAHLRAILADPRLSICAACGKTFATRFELKTHALTHSGERPHVCVYCRKGFTRVYYLEKHVRQMHTPGGILRLSDGEKPHKCAECGLSFAEAVHLDRHRRGAHEPEERPHVCEVCDKAFSQRSTLSQHMRFHTGEKPHACHRCGRAYARKSQLRDHVRASHSCPESDEDLEGESAAEEPTAASRSEPSGTIRRDDGEKLADHSCEACERRFESAADLKRHRLRTHGKKFACRLCLKTFQKRFNLKLHLWRYHELDCGKPEAWQQ